MKTMSIKSKLILLISVMLLSLTTFLGFGIYSQNKGVQSLISLKENQVQPINNLKVVSENLSWGFINNIKLFLQEKLTPVEAIQKITEAKKLVDSNWNSYYSAGMTEEEKKVAESAKQELKKIDGIVGSIISKINSGDREALENLTEQELRPALNKYIEYGTRLSAIQIEVVEDSIVKAKSEYKTTVAVFGTIAAFVVFSGVMVSTLIIRRITRQLREAVDAANSIANGDLTVEVKVERDDELGALMKSIQNMTKKLTDLVTQVRASADSIAIGSQEVAAGSSDLSQRTENQAASLEETAATMEELTATVKQNSFSAQTASQLAVNAVGAANTGAQSVQQVTHTMQEIQEASTKIESFVGVIESVAFQTNILALNAAIEAARAGEAGRGFAVVAQEVRTLAAQCSDAAKDIKSLVFSNVEKVQSGAELVKKASASVEEITVQVKRMNDIVQEISEASKEQTNGIEQVNVVVGELDQATQQNAALVEESSAAAESLSSQSKALISAIDLFKISSQIAAKKIEVVKPTVSASTQKPAKATVKRETPAKPASNTHLEPAVSVTKGVTAKPIAKNIDSDLDEWQNF